MRAISGLAAAALLLAGCGATVSPGGLDDLCRGSSRCAPRCGSVATGASPDCVGAENEGRTRG